MLKLLKMPELPQIYIHIEIHEKYAGLRNMKRNNPENKTRGLILFFRYFVIFVGNVLWILFYFITIGKMINMKNMKIMVKWVKMWRKGIFIQICLVTWKMVKIFFFLLNKFWFSLFLFFVNSSWKTGSKMVAWNINTILFNINI